MLDCSMEEDHFASKYDFPVKKLSGAFAAAEEEDERGDLDAMEEEEEGEEMFVESEVPPVEEFLESKSPIKEKQEVKEEIKEGPTYMKVYLRVRPIKDSSTKAITHTHTHTKEPKEEEKARASTITVQSDTSIVTQAPALSKRAQYTKLEERNYTFTGVFDTESSQGDVYTDTVAPLMRKFVNGESCVFFAYGMTNAGKTHTIQGSKEDPGAMPKLINE